jgi:hypothetical protein
VPNALKTADLAIQTDSFAQLSNSIPVRLPLDPTPILALDAARRVHQAVGQITVCGKEQQTLAVDIKTAYRYPSGTAQPRQVFKNRWPATRVISGTDLANRLVIENHPQHGTLGTSDSDQLLIDSDRVRIIDRGAEYRRTAIDAHTALANPVFDFPPGPNTHTGKNFLNPFSHHGQ